MMSDLIYHYTDINALESILTNHQLWMTSHEFLNDTEEFNDGYFRLKNTIENTLNTNKSNFSSKTIEYVEYAPKSFIKPIFTV